MISALSQEVSYNCKLQRGINKRQARGESVDLLVFEKFYQDSIA